MGSAMRCDKIVWVLCMLSTPLFAGKVLSRLFAFIFFVTLSAQEPFTVVEVKDLPAPKQLIGVPTQLTELAKSFREGNRFLNSMWGRYAPAARVLLFGKSGTGKTSIAYEFVRESNRASCSITGEELYGTQERSGATIVKELFKNAREYVRRENKDLVLIFDDMSAIFGAAKDKDAYKATRATFIKELEENERVLGCRLCVLVLVDTGYIHDSVKKCFKDLTIEITAPTGSVAQDIFDAYLNKYKHEQLSFFDYWKLRSEFAAREMTGRDIEKLVRRAHVLSHGRKITKKHIFKAIKHS